MSGLVVWITGLPASGKTTLAWRARERLAAPSVVLDGDEVRAVLGAHGYGAHDRDEHYLRLGGLAALLARQGVVVLVPATSPLRRHRAAARALAPRFVEVWVRAPVAEAERRDPKGLYARARRGEAPDLPGVGAPYEPPETPDVIADGGHDDGAVEEIARLIEAAA